MSRRVNTEPAVAIFVIVLAELLRVGAACAQRDASVDAARSDDRARALRLAEACVRRPPISGRASDGHALRYDHPAAWLVRQPIPRWHVHFEEQAPESTPSGIEVAIDVATGACTVQPQE